MLLAILVSVVSITSCEQARETFVPRADPLQYVNPFIGTGGHGHTYPGVSRPFGMLQLSPDTRLTGWDGCSGYHYSDSIIYGFSHTHLSGTGVSDYGDVLLMPVNNGDELRGQAWPYETYQSSFSHEREEATAGRYEVYLDRPQVAVSLSSTERGGFHQYKFQAPKNPAIVLDLEHRDEVLACDFDIIGNNRIEGYRHSKAWAEDQRLFFVIEFSTPFSSFESQLLTSGETKAKGLFLFPEEVSEIEVKVAISAVDLDGARRNFEAELAERSFTEVTAESEEVWRAALGKIEATALSADEQTIFYTSLYHTMLAPNLYSDVDGRYRGMDLQVHQDEEHPHYTVFSLWDTHRAAHPLMTIIEQERTADFIHTMLQKYEDGGILPIWDLSACYTGCMIGYHGVSVIADAYIKGIRDYDAGKALEAMMHSANQEHLGLDGYRNNGFIAVEQEAESVSKTLEYAYDDWCIAQMALALGDQENYRLFLERSLHYRNLMDPETKFFRPRTYNFWKAPFDPFEVNSNYTEANAWQYAFAPIHDITGFANLHGGNAELENALDELFSASSATKGRDQVDITGLIGQYAHGNEPSHHIAYLYNYVQKPWKTQARVRNILAEQYANAPDGISGNEDCGQMSAWYVLSAMGFYSVLPGSDYYVIGSPSLSSASVQLENGNTFRMTTANNTPENIYIQSVSLNGEAYQRSFIDHASIMAGGHLHFEMGPDPNEGWGSEESERPVSVVENDSFLQAPYITQGAVSFIDNTVVKLDAFHPDDQLFYSFAGSDFLAYDRQGEGIPLKGGGGLCIYAVRDGQQSATICTQFYQRDGDRSISLQSEFAAIYDGGTPEALIDGLRGGRDYRTGRWQGFEGQHLEFVVDLGSSQSVNNLGCGFLQDENSWIFFPSAVAFYGSADGETFTELGEVMASVRPEEPGVHLEDFSIAVGGQTARYIKVVATSLLQCPPWHKGAEFDGKAWVFADEFTIN